MAKFLGRRVDIGLAKEANYGVGVAPSVWAPHTNFTFDDKTTKATSTEAFSNIFGGGTDSFTTQKWADGDLEGDVNANSFGYILLALFGGAATVTETEAAAVYKHTWEMTNTNEHQSLSISTKDPIGDLIWEGAMLNSLTISATAGEIVTYTANFISKASAGASHGASSYSSDYKFTSRTGQLKLAANVAGLNAATELDIKSFEITFEKNAVQDWKLNTLEPEQVLNRQMAITGNFVLNYEDRTHHASALADTKQAMRIKFTGNDTIGAASNPEMLFEFDRVSFESWEPDKSLDEIASQTINFTVLYDLTNSRAWNNAYVQNTTAVY